MSSNKGKGFQEYNFKNKISSSEERRTCNTAHQFIEKYVAPISKGDSFILNVASVSSSYGLPEKNMQHIDITRQELAYLRNAQVCSTKKTLFSDEAYDIVICAGAALNYTDSMEAIDEFRRVLRPNGLLVLEYENSNVSEFLLKKDFNKKAVFAKTHFNAPQRWRYSDTWINELLVLNKFETLRKRKSHYFSSLLPENQEGIDTLLRFVPFVRNLASNTIVLCRKKPTS